MQLFYDPNITENTSSFSFPKDESKHIVRVLRRKTGDQLDITNGRGLLAKVELTLANINTCVAKIVSSSLQPRVGYSLHLAVAPTKMNDRYEWFLEKATEIGVDTITPLICAHSERKIVKLERFERILQSAMKQSLSCYLPKLNPPMDFDTFVGQNLNSEVFIAHCEKSSKVSLKSKLKPNTNITILIGPEGDFSSNEITKAISNHFIPVTLGNTRLRTETAAIVACHSVAFINDLS